MQDKTLNRRELLVGAGSALLITEIHGAAAATTRGTDAAGRGGFLVHQRVGRIATLRADSEAPYRRERLRIRTRLCDGKRRHPHPLLIDP